MFEYKFTRKIAGHEEDIYVFFNSNTKDIYFDFYELSPLLQLSKEYYDNFNLNSKVFLYKSSLNRDKKEHKYVHWSIYNKFLGSKYKIGRWELFDWTMDILYFLDPNIDIMQSIKTIPFIYASRVLNFEGINKTDLKYYLNRENIMEEDCVNPLYIKKLWFTDTYPPYITQCGVHKINQLLLSDGYVKSKHSKSIKHEVKEVKYDK